MCFFMAALHTGMLYKSSNIHVWLDPLNTAISQATPAPPPLPKVTQSGPGLKIENTQYEFSHNLGRAGDTDISDLLADVYVCIYTQTNEHTVYITRQNTVSTFRPSWPGSPGGPMTPSSP